MTGNTNIKRKKIKQIIGRTWCFTLNNYDITDITSIKNWPDVKRGVFGKELGESGTPHLQGCVTFNKPMALTGVKKLCGKSHWEKTSVQDAAFKYCLKEGSFEWWAHDLNLIDIEHLYPWQKQIWDLCLGKPDDRTIYWYWEPKGCSGKTALCKLLCAKAGGFLFGGSASDIASRCILTGAPTLCIMNLTRTQEGRISWSAIEGLKDGLIQSGKYEGGQLVFNSPHVIVFANFEPDQSLLSEDRWCITEIGDAEPFGFF